MPGTRSSARKADVGSSPTSSLADEASATATTGSKRKAESTTSPKSKRGKKGQKTIEETLPDNGESRDEDAKDKGKKEHEQEEAENEADQKNEEGEEHTAEPTEVDTTDAVREEKGAATDSNGAIEHSSQREKAMPSSVLEKGIIYFFTRGRVGTDEPESVQDLQRTYFVLRPLPADAKLGEGPIEDLKNNRLVALPKKVLPKSGRDRFMVFIEKANTTIQDLKDNFMQGSEYATKTTGTRQTPPVTPIGEGVYAITTTGRESHLAYLLTIPSEIGEVQEDIGLRTKGSFVISLKNPEAGGPAQATLPQQADYPKEIMEEFRGLRWMPPAPKHLDYVNSQILLIGEGQVEKALESSKKDEKQGKDSPEKQIGELEEEDERRVEHLNGDDSVFDDLGISQKDYPKVQTTW
ncbi:MAG: hypothetical protein M1820_004675 [Bogoriella megaspora]|nr:MAG: hypothetical protein M1820_004675 [Bogoriella megaspora]